MSQAPDRLRFVTAGTMSRGAQVGIIETAIGGPERSASLAALFPHVAFTSAGPGWPQAAQSEFDILVAPVDATSAMDVDSAIKRLRTKSTSAKAVVIVLTNADVPTTRRLIREGAADVLPAPPSEPALAACIERLLVLHSDSEGDGGDGQIVAYLKAGGGVGATALAVQTASLLARRDAGAVCIADCDLQFGAAALYLDLPDAVTIDDVLSAGHGFGETPFATTLASHRSGARVLAAPREITPLEFLSPAHADTLLSGLKRDFALTILDLPSVWTSWTNRLLQLTDRIVLVTQLSVPHLHLVKRQMRLLASQGLEAQPLSLVCNALSAEQQSQVSVKAAERALGRRFDVVIPEDRRVMHAAINQGVPIADIRRGTKLEKAIAELSERVAGEALIRPAARS